ncbi:hypothetical protein N7U49_14585 [Streptomyces sp. AD2-2]|nr:hypothetical protein N7U49_14585 [Streptomyces sp. AD2-2]
MGHRHAFYDPVTRRRPDDARNHADPAPGTRARYRADLDSPRGSHPEPGTAFAVGGQFRAARHRPVPVTDFAAVGHGPRRADPTP